MKQHYIKHGIVDTYSQKQGEKSFTGFHLERWLKKALLNFGITLSDCCTQADNTNAQPVRFNPANAGTVEAFNGTAWVEVDSATTQLSPSAAVVSDAQGNLVSSSVSTTQINYLGTLTSNVQTQLNSKATVVTAPVTATSAGTPGQIAYDATHIYICIAANTWIRAIAATF